MPVSIYLISVTFLPKTQRGDNDHDRKIHKKVHFKNANYDHKQIFTSIPHQNHHAQYERHWQVFWDSQQTPLCINCLYIGCAVFFQGPIASWILLVLQWLDVECEDHQRLGQAEKQLTLLSITSQQNQANSNMFLVAKQNPVNMHPFRSDHRWYVLKNV